MSRTAAMCYLSETFPPIEGLNFALWPHPNWPVMCGHASAGSPIRLHLAGWELYLQSCWDWGADKCFPAILPKFLKWFQKSLFILCCCFKVFFSKFPVRCPRKWKMKFTFSAFAQNILLLEMNFSLRSRVLFIIYPLRLPYSDLGPVSRKSR